MDRSHIASRRSNDRPYSDTVRIGDLRFLSGRIGLDYSNMTLVEGNIAAQPRQCLANIADV
ncbi:hypothetical protein DC429_14130 [Arthrobacter sp. TPD3018]|nr:hypothetical protein DC425_13030 [Sphingomonas sp. TPD3009]PVE54829.1 hypothetical protein DC429_14130 [Arthrobacter sp. TPD3018]PVE82589.1 hypothetical protein DC431_11665 [Sphingomonas melonis]